MNNFLSFRCDGEAFCDIEVNSGVFGDPCPNTHKYVEVHYACSSKFGRLSGSPTTKKLPPWFLQGSAGSLWTSEAIEGHEQDQQPIKPIISNPEPHHPVVPQTHHKNRVPQKPNPRKPILVSQDAIQTTTKSPSVGEIFGDNDRRIPITTPKPQKGQNLGENGAKTGESDETASIRSEKQPNLTPLTPDEYTTISSGKSCFCLS